MKNRQLAASFCLLVIVIIFAVSVNHFALPAWRNYVITEDIEHAQKKFLQNHAADHKDIVSNLPITMPAQFTFSYYRNGGMLPTETEIKFGTSTLSVYTLNQRGKAHVHTDPLTTETRAKLYAFVRILKMDKTVVQKNSEPELDAPSSNIVFTLDPQNPSSTTKLYVEGTNNLESSWAPEWLAIRGVIDNVLKMYQ